MSSRSVFAKTRGRWGDMHHICLSGYSSSVTCLLAHASRVSKSGYRAASVSRRDASRSRLVAKSSIRLSGLIATIPATALHAVRGRQVLCVGWTVVSPPGRGPVGQAEGPVAVIPTGDRLKVSEGESGARAENLRSRLTFLAGPHIIRHII